MRRFPMQAATWIFLAVGILGILLFFNRLNSPLARRTLPDGTELGFTVSYGTEHEFKIPPRPGAPLLERIRYLFSPERKTTTLNSPDYVFRFTGRKDGDPASDKINAIRCIWEDGQFHEATLRHEGGEAWWPSPAFPRRGGAVRTQIQVNGSWHEWILPNPAPTQQQFEKWKADPFPQRRQFGDVEYVAHGWRKAQHGWYVDYTLFVHDEEHRSRTFGASTQVFRDATGNTSSEALSPSEPVWHVKHTARTGKVPLSPAHVRRLATFNVPSPGESGIQTAPLLDGFGTLDRFVAYTGGGPYYFTSDQVAPPLKEKPAEGTRTGNPRKQDTNWTLKGTADGPCFLLITYIGSGWSQPRPPHRWKLNGRTQHSPPASGSYYTGGAISVERHKLGGLEGEIVVEDIREESFQVEYFATPPGR